MQSRETYFEPVLDVTHRQILEDLAQVHALAKVIRWIPIPPHVQQRLDKLNIPRAVRGTTGIEGTELSEEEVNLVVESPPGAEPLGPGRKREEQEVRIIAFRDYAREILDRAGKLGTPAGQRQLSFLIRLGDNSVSLKELRSGGHPLSRPYRNVTTRTLMRDINTLTQQNLITMMGDEIRANLELMTRFTA